VLTAALAAVAVVAGLTGTWSPCGFSMIETIGGPRRHVVPSCAAFAIGALAGGAVTFGLLAFVGAAVDGGRAMILAAVAVAVGAALAEMRGAAVAPQVRRQVPEHWRRVLPLWAAAGLYGFLLGLGLTTFVLTFAVWALAAVTFAVGAPVVGVLVGLAFGAGRALPIVVVAPLADRPVGVRLRAAMAERPRLLRAVRLTDGTALLLAAAALFAAEARAAARIGVGSDPTAAGGLVVWTTPTGGVALHEGQTGTAAVPAHAVVGGSLLAWRDGDIVHVVRAVDMVPVVDVTIPGADAIAVSDRWLVARAPTATGEAITAAPLASPTEVRTVATVRRPSRLGRPSLDLDTIAWHVATSRASSIVAYDLARSRSRVLRRSTSALLTQPSLLGTRLLYVRQTNLAQLLEVGAAAPGGHDRVLYRLAAPAPHDAGYERGHSHVTRTPRPRTAAWTLWTSALSPTHAYVTLLPRRRGAQPWILSVPR
jgi:hypothetical protein